MWVSANFLASLFGLTLKPIRIAWDALARVTSVSVITPIFDKIIFGVTSAWSIFSIAVLIASLDPWTSDFIIMASSFGPVALLKTDSLLAAIKGDCFVSLSSILYLLIFF